MSPAGPIEGFRLSPQQARLWRLLDNGPHTFACATSTVLIEGQLDAERFALALAQVVERHEILRTAFRQLPSMTIPLQVVNDPGRADYRYEDWSRWDRQRQQLAIAEYSQRGERDRCNIQTGPVLLARLAKLATDRHCLMLRLPLLCSDRRGLVNLVAELSRCYQRNRAAEEPMQYADFAEWQNELLESEETAAGRAFWQRQNFADALTCRLPFHRPMDSIRRVDARPPEFARERVRAGPGLTEKISALARQEDADVNVLLLTGWHLILGRLTGRQETLVGMLSDGRKFLELHNALGLFARYLPISCNLHPRASFRDAVRQVQECTAERRKWEEYFSWEQLARTNGEAAEASACSFGFDGFENPQRYDEGALAFIIDQQDVNIDQFPLELRCVRAGGTTAFDFRYDTDAFAAEDVRCLADHFVTLVNDAVHRADAPCGSLMTLSQPRREQQLARFHTPPAQLAEPSPIHRLFEKQAAGSPDAVAVVVEESQLTYGALDRRANQIARQLRQLGVGPEELVALCVERSPEFAVGMLGILKSGGAYVPLDPLLPRKRLRFMLQDCQPRAVLTQTTLRERLPDWHGPTVTLEGPWPRIASDATDLPTDVSPKNLVYVLYTSGSSGRPKGVALEHRQLFNYMQGVLPRLALPPRSSFATVSTFAADLGNTAIYPALCGGGRLHVLRQERAADAQAMSEYMRRHHVDCLKIVPSHLRTLMGSSAQECVLPTRTLVLGGEASDWDLVEQTRKQRPGLRVMNHYGPTEAAVGVLADELRLPPRDDSRSATLPLGRPIGDTQIDLTDAQFQPVASWVPGELFIGGASVARGYFRRPALTAEQFVPDPHGSLPGRRLYRTGDMARYTAGPEVEFLGRRDGQVKIRGFRIELSEVKSALGGFAGVRDAVVIAREDRPGQKRLVAYVVLNDPSVETASALRRSLQDRLPDYMVPSAIVPVKTIPLTPNGKLDVSALPVPESTAATEKFDAPANVEEELVASIWTDVLGVEKLGRQENFFELGGHSLMATQLISRVRQAFQVELPLRSLFDAPTVAGMARQIKTSQRFAEDNTPAIERTDRGGELPLSFAQQRLWFLDQLEPGSSFYNVSAPVRLQGTFQPRDLEQTIRQIVCRHEVLRTTFPTIDGRPRQRIETVVDFRLPMVDLTALPRGARQAVARRIANEEASRPFNLTQGPLLRAALVRLARKEHLVLLTMHHIVCDGWSTGILIREMASVYEARCQGQQTALAESPIQYADFASWQRGWLRGDVLERQLAFWRNKFDGQLPVLELPTDRPRPAVQRYRGSHQDVALGPELSAQLVALSRQEGVTPFMVLLAALKTLLYRWSGQHDVVVGTPIANRNRVEIEPLVGFFVNTLALRTNLSGNPTFRELLHRVRHVSLEASAHQDLPFEKLVDELQPERNVSHTPIFQVVFVLGNVPSRALELNDLSVTPLEVEGGTAKFDLTLYLCETASGLAGRFEYNTDLFDDASIRRMCGHLHSLLQSAVNDPKRRLSELTLLTAAERQQLLEDWNQKRREYRREDCIHAIFEARVRDNPDAIALTFQQKHYSYQQINVRANQLAHYLLAQGVGLDVPVALFLNRSPEMVVAMLGVLKAGAAYVPLEPTYPEERIAYILRDIRADHVLCSQSTRPKLPELDVRTILVDGHESQIASQPTSNPASGATAENLAYVIYTSGSTGQPKGCLITHANVTRLFDSTAQSYQFSDHDVWSMFHSYAFDFSVWEVWGALFYGGRLVVVPFVTSRAPDDFHRLLSREQITVLNQTPSAFRQLCGEDEAVGQAHGSLALRLVIFGGEALEPPSLAGWFERHGDQCPRLVNMYGITETTVHVTYRPMSSADVCRGSVIGMALDDLSINVLDPYQNPVPMRVPGELYVGGAGLARGYLSRPELTAERFVPDPFSRQPGDRLYRSGDVARYLVDGDLEYVGRADRQVKLRGFRIELGEIETVLRTCPAVREAAVILREDSSTSNQLVAYVVGGANGSPTPKELRDLLKQSLPDYMIPAAFMTLDQMPLSPNGKIDRRALPQPESDRQAPQEGHVAPRDDVEQTLADIWSHVLGIHDVGIHDNFFEVGGDSILSIQIVARANQAGLRLTPAQLFQHQTIAELAAVVNRSAAVQAEQGPVVGPVPLTPIQHWFFEQQLVDPHHWNQAMLFELRQPILPERLASITERLLFHHDALRLRFQPSDQGWTQQVRPMDVQVPFCQVELSTLAPSRRVAALESIAAQVQASLDLSRGPLLRFVLFTFGLHERDRLLIVVHHLAIDGVSWRILLEDFIGGYEQLRTGDTFQLPPKSTSFQSWAERLTEYARSSELQSELAYWCTDHWLPHRPLPTDGSSGDNTEASVGTVTVCLSDRDTRALLQEVPAAYHTQIEDVLLTALAKTLAMWTGHQELIIDMEGHGREPIFDDVDLTRTVGWFTSIYPLRLTLPAENDPGQLLVSVKEQRRQVPIKGVGYGALHYLMADASITEPLRATPRPELSFNYLGQLDQVLPDESPLVAATDDAGPRHSGRARRSHLLDVRGSIFEGRLRVHWIFSKNIHRQSTIEGLADDFITSLRALIEYCQTPEAGGYTPSDFPLAELDQENLDEVFREIEFEIP